MEKMFETILWNSRFVVILAVIASLFAAFAMFYMATVNEQPKLTHIGIEN